MKLGILAGIATAAAFPPAIPFVAGAALVGAIVGPLMAAKHDRNIKAIDAEMKRRGES